MHYVDKCFVYVCLALSHDNHVTICVVLGRFGELHSPSISPRVSKRLSLDSGQPRAKPAVRRLVSDSAVASAGRMR